MFAVVPLCFFSFAQRTKIDSLKKALPSLHDSAAIDCLNILSLLYSYLNVDTANFYAEKAYSESAGINYLRGKAMSLNNSARIAGHGFHDFPEQQKISVQIIQLYKNGKDEKVIAEAFMNLALAFFCQGNFDSSVEACNAVVNISKKNGNKKESGESLAILGCINLETGNYEKAFECFNESLGIFKSINDSYNTSILLAKIGDLYRLAGDQKTALSFYFQSLEYPKGTSLQWNPLVDLGDTYYSLQPEDSTSDAQEKYVQTIKSLTVKSNYIAYPKIRIAEMNIAYKEYNKAIVMLIDELKLSEKNNDKNQTMRLLLDLGKAYEGKKDFTKAFYYTNDLLQNAKEHNLKQYIRDGYQLMSGLYDSLHKVDSAYFYYRQYTSMKDSVAFGEFSKKLSVYIAATENDKKQGQILILNNQKLIGQQQLQLSGQQLKSESFLKNILLTGVLILILLGFIIFRNISLKRKNEASRHEIVEKELTLQKLESERTKIELKQQATELELQALRAQMNPHFIFNCLNSINRFIITKETTKAADHLTKFAKLIRIVLQQSGKPLIPLEDELYCLQLYMDLEALRFEIPFHYVINCNGINTSAVMIPSLLIQPFVENAIWHGLHPKENTKRL